MFYKITFEGDADPMSTVSGSFNLVVNPAVNQLTLTPSSGTLNPETEGVNDPGQLVCEVTGGTQPYTFQATGVPNGLSLAQAPAPDGVGVDVILSGTPVVGDATGSPYTIALTVTDSAGNSVSQAMRGKVVKG